MPVIKLDLSTRDSSSATFDGVIKPIGSVRYAFSGTLKANCILFRGESRFENAVRFGHGGTSGDYKYFEYKLGKADRSTKTFAVEGEGERAPNETVDFRIGFNEGVDGQFYYGNRLMITVGGPSQAIRPFYKLNNSAGHSKYDVYFDGSARADGPTGFAIEGTLSAQDVAGALTVQHACLGYKTASGKWKYQTCVCDDTEQVIAISGSRNAGESIQVLVGATSQVANLYDYGDIVECELPDLF